MQTKIIKLTDSNKEGVLNKAVEIIHSGGLVVFPTETVYGLGADVFNEEALKSIFLAKGRPNDNPIIVHIGEKEQLKKLSNEISPIEQKLIDNFWPGPFTIIFKKKKEIPNIVSGGLSTIAVRMPVLSFTREFINLAGVPIAAPSANTSGRPSSTTGEDAYADLLGKVDLIIDAGGSNIGIESTVVKVENNQVLILRPGAITKEMIEEVIPPMSVIFAKDKIDLHVSPGTKYKHYATKAKMELVLATTDKIGGEMFLRAEILRKKELAVGIICTKQNENLFNKYEPNVFILGDQNNLEEISQKLFSALRFFDTHKVDVILCESFPKQGLGTAIMDRLERASGEK